MKKLRLIKPWDLGVVRQKLDTGIRVFDCRPLCLITAQGPLATTNVNTEVLRNGIPCNNAQHSLKPAILR